VNGKNLSERPDPDRPPAPDTKTSQAISHAIQAGWSDAEIDELARTPPPAKPTPVVRPRREVNF